MTETNLQKRITRVAKKNSTVFGIIPGTNMLHPALPLKTKKCKSILKFSAGSGLNNTIYLNKNKTLLAELNEVFANAASHAFTTIVFTAIAPQCGLETAAEATFRRISKKFSSKFLFKLKS